MDQEKMEHYLGMAKEEGISQEEIGAVQSIVMAVSASRVSARFREVQAGVQDKNGLEDM